MHEFIEGMSLRIPERKRYYQVTLWFIFYYKQQKINKEVR